MDLGPKENPSVSPAVNTVAEKSHETNTSSSSSNPTKDKVAEKTTEAGALHLSQSPYAPQFSAATSFILNRIKNVSSPSNSTSLETPKPITETSEDVYPKLKPKSEGDQRPRTSLPDSPRVTQLLSIGDSKLRTIAPKPFPIESSTLGIKRKRESEDQTDFAQNTIAFSATQSPQSQGGPNRTDSSVTKPCDLCHQNAFSPSNLLVSCHRCGTFRHQACCSPPLGAQEARNMLFACESCVSATKSLSRQHEGSVDRSHSTKKIRQELPDTLAQGVVPAKPELVGFGAGAASDDVRTAYFHNMKKTDLLNILSFCDQLKPQLIVDIMVSVSKRHPDLPMFASPNWHERYSNPASTKILKRGTGKSGHGHSLLNSKAKQRIKTGPIKNGTRKPSSSSSKKNLPVVVNPAQEPEVVEDVVDEDPLPPAWPRSDQGMYAKLAPEVEDRRLLKDDNDEGAFSHFMVSSLGKQIIDPV